MLKIIAVILILIFIYYACRYIRIFLKRMGLAHRVRKLCRKNALRFEKTHFFWALGRRRSKRCDFYIETPQTVFSVKLFSTPKYHSHLIFQEDGHYIIRRFLTLISTVGLGVRIPLDSKPQNVPDVNFRYRYADEWYLKNHRSILLIHPTSVEIRLKPDSGKEVLIGNSEALFGMEIYTLHSLLSAIEMDLHSTERIRDFQ